MNNNPSDQTGPSDENSIFGEIVHSYTRAQAIADGFLVDVSSVAREAGWRFPVAITIALWNDIQRIPENSSHEDVQGRLWDVVWMAALKAKHCEGSRFTYELILHREGRENEVAELIADCGPGDAGEPVITIGYPEDF